MCFVKRGVLKISQNSQENRILFFNKVAGFRQLFLQSNSGGLFLECEHCKNEVREIDCLCYRAVDAMLISSAKTLECEGSMRSSSFYGDLPDY